MKKSIALCLMLLTLLPLCSACQTKEPEIFLCTDLVKYNRVGDEEFGFNVTLISPKKVEVQFIGFEGENTEGLTVRQTDDTYDELKSRIGGQYVTLLGFTCHTANPSVQIDAVKLNIDGKEGRYAFQEPIRHTVSAEEDEAECPVILYSVPTFISSVALDEQEFSFTLSPEEDATITDFSFNDFITVKSARVVIDGDEKGELRDLLPLKVSAGSQIEWKAVLGAKNTAPTAHYDSIYCNFVLECQTEDGRTYSERRSLVSQSISNKDDALAVVKLMTGNE